MRSDEYRFLFDAFRGVFVDHSILLGKKRENIMFILENNCYEEGNVANVS